MYFMQETHFNKCVEWPGEAFYSFHSTHSAGVAIVFSQDFQGKPELVHSSVDGRLCVVDCKVDDQTLRLFNIYAPNNPQERVFFFTEEIEPFLLVKGINIIGGDFNCIDSVEKDSLRHSSNTLSLVGSSELTRLTNQFGLVDTYRTENPEGSEMTWYGHNGSQGSRLDMFFCIQFLENLECLSIL